MTGDADDLLAQLRSDDVDKRADVLRELARLGPDARVHADLIAERAWDVAPSVRRLAAWALERVEARTDRTLDALADLLEDDDGTVRNAAATALRSLPRRSPRIDSRLIALALDPAEHASFEAVAALAAHADSLAAVAAELVPRLDATNEDTVVQTLATLVLLQQPIPGVASRLPALYERGGAVRAEVVGLIGSARMHDGAALVEAALAGEEQALYASAAWALGQLGTASDAALARMRALLEQEPDEGLAAEITDALSTLEVTPDPRFVSSTVAPDHAAGEGDDAGELAEPEQPVTVARVRALSSEEAEALRAVTQTARAALDLELDADASTVIAAVGAFIDRTRAERTTVEDDDLRLGLGGLWGEQLIAELGWTWRHATWTSGYATFVVLAPDESWLTTPLDSVADHLDGVTATNTSILLFNMIVAGNLPAAGPAAHVLLR